MTILKYTAKSASDRTDDWPFWMVCNGHKNVTAAVARALGYDYHYGGAFSSRDDCKILSREANEKGLTL